MLSIKIGSFSCWNFRHLHDNCFTKFTLLESLFNLFLSVIQCQACGYNPYNFKNQSEHFMMVQQIQEKRRVQLFSVFQLSTIDSNTDICFKKFHNNSLQLLHRYLEIIFVLRESICINQHIEKSSMEIV